MDEFLKRLAEQAAVIKAAPYPFALAVLVAAGAIWLAVNWAYAAILASKTAQLELADRQLAEYKQKLSGASPDEAKTKIETLISEVTALRNQMQGRRLTPEQRNKIIEAIRLPNSNNLQVQIVREVSAQDTGALANDFMTAFQAAGWKTGYGSMMFGAPSPTGLALLVSDQNKLSPTESIVLAALRAAQIQFDVLQSPSSPNTGDEARIWITGR